MDLMKNEAKGEQKTFDFSATYWYFHRWEGEIQGIDGIINVYPFLHIDSYVTYWEEAVVFDRERRRNFGCD